MATGRGENEGFHLLPEFACDAIPEPGLFPPGTVFGRSDAEGMHILDAFVIESFDTLRDDPPAAPDAEPPG